MYLEGVMITYFMYWLSPIFSQGSTLHPNRQGILALLPGSHPHSWIFPWRYDYCFGDTFGCLVTVSQLLHSQVMYACPLQRRFLSQSHSCFSNPIQMTSTSIDLLIFYYSNWAHRNTRLSVSTPLLSSRETLRRFSLICRQSRSRRSLKIFAPLLTFATKHGRYLGKWTKEEWDWHPLFCPRE